MPWTAWRPCPRPWSTGWSCWSTCCRSTPTSWSATPSWSAGRAIDLVKTSEEFLHASWAAAAGGGQAPIDLGASSYQPLADVRAAALARGLAWWTLSPFSAGPAPEDGPSTDAGIIRTDDGEIIDFRAQVSGSGVESRIVAGQAGETYRGDTESAVNDIAKRIRDGWRVVLMAEGKGMSTRMTEVLTEHDLPVRTVADLDEPPTAGIGTVVTGDLSHGFVADTIKLAVFTTHDLSGQRTRRQGHPQDARAAEEPDRPAGAEHRRRGGAQPARRRPLRRR